MPINAPGTHGSCSQSRWHKDFKIMPPAVDNRTTPTGKFASTNIHTGYSTLISNQTSQYEIHEPRQEAYGDWAAINIGGQYYIFGDYDLQTHIK